MLLIRLALPRMMKRRMMCLLFWMMMLVLQMNHELEGVKCWHTSQCQEAPFQERLIYRKDGRHGHPQELLVPLLRPLQQRLMFRKDRHHDHPQEVLRKDRRHDHPQEVLVPLI
jgi:hypothetical protein